MSEPYTSPNMVALFETTKPQLNALIEAIEPHVARHPTSAVPPMVDANARAVLAAARRVVSRDPGQRSHLELRGPLSWAELDAKLALALTALGAFKRRYFVWNGAGQYAWRTNPHPTPSPRDTSTPLTRAKSRLQHKLAELAEQL